MMKKCLCCGENATIWGKNFPCQPSIKPLWNDDLSDQPELSAIARGFSAGDIIRDKYGHVAIVTFANDKWGDIRCRYRSKFAREIISSAMACRIIKKASVAQAKRWLDPMQNKQSFAVSPFANTDSHEVICGVLRLNSSKEIGIFLHNVIEHGIRNRTD